MTRTLWDALCGIEDRRGKKGRQYKLQSLLGILIAAMLVGANDLIAIFRWGRRLPEARENFREDRAEAVAIVTGRLSLNGPHEVDPPSVVGLVT